MVKEKKIMKNKISVLPIVFILITICFLSGFTTVQAGPKKIISVPSGPSTGDTCELIQFYGDYLFGWGEPVTYEWDFDYDGCPINFTVDNSSENPEWSFNLGKTYTVALRVTDCMEEWDIGMLDINITATYDLQIFRINVNDTIQGEIAEFNGTVINYGNESSPSYTVYTYLCKFNWSSFGWEFYCDVDNEEFDPLTGNGSMRDFDPDDRRMNESGSYRLYAEIKVDGVTVDVDYKFFSVN